MIQKLEIRGLILDSGNINYEKDKFSDYIKFVEAYKGKEITVIFDASDSRSKRQNAFFHGVIIPATQRILREHGHPKWKSQEYVKEAILKKPFLTMNVGEHDEYIRHTSDLKVGEMWKFINQCLVLIADLGGNLRPEEQQKYLDIVEKFKLEDSIDDAIEKNL